MTFSLFFFSLFSDSDLRSTRKYLFAFLYRRLLQLFSFNVQLFKDFKLWDSCKKSRQKCNNQLHSFVRPGRERPRGNEVGTIAVPIVAQRQWAPLSADTLNVLSSSSSKDERYLDITSEPGSPDDEEFTATGESGERRALALSSQFSDFPSDRG